MSLEKAYDEIKTKFNHTMHIEPYKVVKSVDEHRNFWKPNKVRILLLAESHVYTTISDHDNTMQYNRFPKLEKCPANYVRLVYCLGYGEQCLANVNTNKGTPQFWKIFAACVNQNVTIEAEKILLSKTLNFYQRLNNKIMLLEKLKEKGIWLLDASIVALYQDNVKPSPKTMKEIIESSWEHYISNVIHENHPEKIIIIGKGVAKTLEENLSKVNTPVYVQSQPQGIRRKNDLKKSFEKYYEMCNG